MLYNEEQQLALALYDALTPDDRQSVLALFRELASSQESSSDSHR